jgi:hypothetical protein
MVSEALKLEVVKLAVRSSIRLQKTSDSIVERPSPSRTKEEITDGLLSGAVGALAASESSVSL